MAWLGEGLSTLKGQITNFTKEVLSDGKEDGSDATDVETLQKKVQDLESFCASQDLEICELRERNEQLVVSLREDRSKGDATENSGNDGHTDSWSSWDQPGFRTQYEPIPLEVHVGNNEKEGSEGQQYLKDQLGHLEAENNLMKRTCSELEDQVAELSEKLQSISSKVHDSKHQGKPNADDRNMALETQLRGQLQAADLRVRNLEKQLEQAQQQLLDQLTESQSAVSQVRSNLEQTRSQLVAKSSPESTDMQQAKQDISNRILQIAEKRRELESNLKALQSKGKHLASNVASIIQKLGDAEQQEFVRGALYALELENQVLRLRNAELETCTESLKGYGFDLDFDYKVDHFGDDDSLSSSSVFKMDLLKEEKQTEDTNVAAITARICKECDQLILDKQSLTCELEAMESTVQDLEAKMATMVDENVALSSNLEELDQQHQVVIDQLLAGKKTLLKENETLNLELAKLKQNDEPVRSASVVIGTDNCSLNLENKIPSTSKDQYEDYKKTFDDEFTENIMHLIPFDLPKEHNNNNEEFKSTCVVKALVKICEESKWKKDTLERKVAEVMKEVRDMQVALEEREERINHLEQVTASFKINEEALIEELMASKSSNGEVLASIPENNEDVEILEQRIAVLEKQLRDKAMLEDEVTSLREERAVVARRFQIAEASLDNEENYQICTGQELQEALLANADLQSRCDVLTNRIKNLEETENNLKAVNEQYFVYKELLDNKSFELDEAMSINSRLEEDLATASDSLKQALLACSELEKQNNAHLATMALQGDISNKICEECSRSQGLLIDKEDQLQMALDSKNYAESEVSMLTDRLQQAMNHKSQLDTECELQLNKIKAQEEEIKCYSDLQQEVSIIQNQLSMKQKELEDSLCTKSLLEADVEALKERLRHADQDSASAAAQAQNSEDILQSKLKLESEIVEWKEKCLLLLNMENSYKTEISGLVNTLEDLRQKIEAAMNEKENIIKQLADKEDQFSALMTSNISMNEQCKEIGDRLLAKSVEVESMQTAMSLLQQQQEELIAAKLEAESKGVKVETSRQDVELVRIEVEKWKEMASASERQLDEALQARASLETECKRLFSIETKLHSQEHLEREVVRLTSMVESAEQRLAEAAEANKRLTQATSQLEKQVGDKQSMEEEAAEWREQCLLKEHQLQDAANTNERIEAECQRLLSEVKRLDVLQSDSGSLKKMLVDLQEQFDDLSKSNSALTIEFESSQKIVKRLPKMEDELNEWKEKLRVTESQLNEVVMKKIELERECQNMKCSLQDMKRDSNQDCLEKMDREKPHLDDKYSTEKVNEESRASQERAVQLETLKAEKERMLSVLDEKIRENGLLKVENHHLMQMISAEKIATNKLQEEKDETVMQHHMQSSESYLMAKETVANLSEIIKNKDLEIETITHKCDTLDKALQEEKKTCSTQLSRLMAERDELIRTVQLKHQESLQYHAEIQRLSGLLNQELGRSEQIRLQFEDKQKILLNTQNELIAVKQRLDKLEQAASIKSGNVLSEYGAEVIQSNSDSTIENKVGATVVEEKRSKEEDPMIEQRSIHPLTKGMDSHKSVPMSAASSQDHRDVLIQELQGECSQLHDRIQQEATRNIYLQNEVQEQHEKESALLRELERLRLHLVAVEESYTLEAVHTEDQIRDLQGKLAQAEERIKSCSTALTSASVRANQHVESLQGQTRLIGQQRDDIQVKLSAAEDQIQRHVAALTNLQAVLEQFQRDKDREVVAAKARLQRELQSAEDRQVELLAQAASLKAQLVEAKEGLSAAARLGEQLDKKTEAIAELKEEVARLQTQLSTAEKREESASLNAEGKIDRYLMKNLLIGYLSAPANTKPQALRILGTVLDFNLEERGRAGLEPGTTGSGGWLHSLLHPGMGTPSNQSISEAFIRFLESESRPQPQLRLLPTIQETQQKAESDSPVPKGRSPSLLTEVQLPTFTQFPVPRSSSSILKDVLKDS